MNLKVYENLNNLLENLPSFKKLTLLDYLILSSFKEFYEASQLDELYRLDAPNISKSIKKLFHLHFINIEIIYEDRRCKYIILSQEGKKFIEEIEKVARPSLDGLLSQITHSDFAHYIRISHSLSMIKDLS